jgi:CDP-glucose 4,6-dehydratase
MQLAECLNNPGVQGQAFNFSPEQPMTVLELVAHIQRLMDCEYLKPKILNVAKGEIYSQYLSAEKAQHILGWQHQFKLEDGLKETIEWYHEYLAH